MRSPHGEMFGAKSEEAALKMAMRGNEEKQSTAANWNELARNHGTNAFSTQRILGGRTELPSMRPVEEHLSLQMWQAWQVWPGPWRGTERWASATQTVRTLWRNRTTTCGTVLGT